MSGLKIAIVGTGAVGGYLGAVLTKHDYDVTLIATSKHCNTIQQNGLKVIEYKQDDFTVFPYVVESVEYDIFDVVFIATKSYDVESACKSIQTCVDQNTLIIPLSNGVQHSQTIKKYLPDAIVCDGAIYLISELKEIGVVHRKSFTFYLIFGSQKENINLKVLEQLLNSCGLQTKYSKDIQYDCWKKYLFISAMATLTSYFQKPIGYIVEEQLELLIDTLLEIKNVANKKNIALNSKDIEKAIKQATHLAYEAKTSMQLDFEKNRPTELEALTGYIVYEAKNIDIQTPHMQKMYEKLKK
jgi:2-dehydropantoate 2-reductase